jgi:2-hydroxycyclohexanecarboxyl-CoA dehydrogenase
MRLDGKIAMVTGGVSGIGKATVLEFARCGAKVICADINVDKGAELEREAGAQKLPIEFGKIDMADSGTVRACAAQVLARHGRVDILVNAAGWNDFQLFLDNKPEYMDRVLAVNLTGALHLTHALLPAMISAGGGKIVSVASDAGRVGSTGETVYAAAKAGLIGFTKSLAREMARYKINVNCVCPGPTDTPMMQSRPDKIKDAFVRAIAFRRFAKPQEIADAILFFASPRSDYVTGQVLSVSGGLTFAG